MQTESSITKSTLSARAHSRAMVAMATLAIAVAMSACGSSDSSTSSTGSGSVPTSILNTRTVERAIEQSILTERNVHATVSCPDVVPQQKGQNFVCIAKTGSTKTRFAVIQTNDNGHVTYHAAK